MARYTKPQQWKKEGSERLRGEGDQINRLAQAYDKFAIYAIRKQCLMVLLPQILSQT